MLIVDPLVSCCIRFCRNCVVLASFFHFPKYVHFLLFCFNQCLETSRDCNSNVMYVIKSTVNVCRCLDGCTCIATFDLLDNILE